MLASEPAQIHMTRDFKTKPSADSSRGMRPSPPTWPESDADVSRGHLRAADGGVYLHLDLRLLDELRLTASLEQLHRQVAAPARCRPIQKVLEGGGRGSHARSEDAATVVL